MAGTGSLGSVGGAVGGSPRESRTHADARRGGPAARARCAASLLRLAALRTIAFVAIAAARVARVLAGVAAGRERPAVALVARALAAARTGDARLRALAAAVLGTHVAAARFAGALLVIVVHCRSRC